MQPFFSTDLLHRLREAARDSRYLLGRGYPRDRVFDLAGDRYDLDRDARHLLRRAVFPPALSRARKRKAAALEDLKGAALAVDGFNVLITLESALLHRPLVLADDGVVRDIAGLSRRYVPSGLRDGVTGEALQWMLGMFEAADPSECYIGLHRSMRFSGELARVLREELDARGIPGTAETLRSVESALPGKGDVVVSADSTLLDRASRVFDLAGYVVLHRLKLRPIRL